MSALAAASVDPATGEVFDERAARRLTDEIRATVGRAWELIVTSYRSEAWRQLGYLSWDAYLAGEFADLQLRPPREQRRDVVSSLREAGLSVRAIAAVTGASTNTVQRDVSDVSRFATVEPDEVSRIATPDEDGFDAGPDIDDLIDQTADTLTPRPEPPRRAGLDGRRRRTTTPPPGPPDAVQMARAAAQRDARKVQALADAWPVLDRLTGDHRTAVLELVDDDARAWLDRLGR